MGIREASGIYGKFKGIDVYVINRGDYSYYYEQKPDVVFCLKDDGLKLVYQGEVIGYATDDGKVTEVKRRKYLPVIKEEEERKETDYSPYSRVVDSFFQDYYKKYGK